MSVANPNTQKPVAILIPCLLTGGTEVATYETALAFKAQAMPVDVIVYFDEIDPVMLQTFQSANINIIALGAVRGQGIYRQWILMWRLFSVLLRGRYRIIWLQYMTPTLLPLLIARLLTRHLVAAVHVAAHHFQPPAIKRLRWLTRHWLTRLVCVSQTTADGIFKGTGMQAQVTVIPNTLNLAHAQAANTRDWRVELGWPKQSLVLGFVGRLATIKGADVLLEAVALAYQQLPQLKLVLVGDGDERCNLELQAKQLGIADLVHFAGRLTRDAIYSATKGFDVAVIPSREEGFGLSALEAMAAGVPVLTSRVDALTEVIIDGKTGLLFEVGNATALAEAIVNLGVNGELRMQMGQAGVQQVAAHYDISIYRQRMVAFVSELTN
ncbi:glycosyltransferase family 4 protein [Crenothrix sp.]|uniref:glycosyltransferase family 4 protein n=1 Tax=Crenothrix sp. TaxID=3100433 RepID=UPI00374DE555